MAPDDAALRLEMVETCRRMNATGLNQGTSGNLSVRSRDGFLITPTSCPMTRWELRISSAWISTAVTRERVGHPPKWRFHRDMLRERSDVDTVLHGGSRAVEPRR